MKILQQPELKFWTRKNYKAFYVSKPCMFKAIVTKNKAGISQHTEVVVSFYKTSKACAYILKVSTFL